MAWNHRICPMNEYSSAYSAWRQSPITADLQRIHMIVLCHVLNLSGWQSSSGVEWNTLQTSLHLLS